MPYVTDTHPLVWHMMGDPKLSIGARRAFEEADDGQDDIVIPCIVFYELVYLTEKGKLATNFDNLIAIIPLSSSSSEPEGNYRIERICLPIIERSRMISREEVSDPWDRLIVATSLHLGFPLITRDRYIQRTAQEVGVEIIW